MAIGEQGACRGGFRSRRVHVDGELEKCGCIEQGPEIGSHSGIFA